MMYFFSIFFLKLLSFSECNHDVQLIYRGLKEILAIVYYCITVNVSVRF